MTSRAVARMMSFKNHVNSYEDAGPQVLVKFASVGL